MIVATIIVALNERVTHQAAHRMLTSFTDRNTKKRLMRKDMPLTMKVFPANVNDFLNLHRVCYKPDSLPVPTRFEPQLIKDMIPFISARKNNALLKRDDIDSNALVQPPAAGGQSMNMQQMFGACMQSMVREMGQAMFGAMRGPDGMGNITITPPSKRSRGYGHDSIVDGQIQTPPFPPLFAGAGHVAGAGPVIPDAPVQPEPPTVEPKADYVDEESDDEAGDDIDKMLVGVGAPKGKGKPKAKGSAKAKAAGKSAMKVTKKAMKAASRPEPVSYTTRPKLGTACPLFYKGCKVYDSATKKTFRVYPRPGTSVYDKGFPYITVTKKKAWTDALGYCEKPTIPKGSSNYVK